MAIRTSPSLASNRGTRELANVQREAENFPTHPRTQYARSGDVSIAYQVTGSGPVDMVRVQGWISNLDYDWEYPQNADLLHRLGRFTRLIRFDKRGTGLSDR